MAIRTISNAGGNWNATTAWVEGVIPTAADEVRATSTSGNLTLNVNGNCRSIDLTGYTGTFTHPTTTLNIGDTVAPTGLVALKWGGTYVNTGNGSYLFNFISTAAGVHTIDTAGKTIAGLSISGTSIYTCVSNTTLIYSIQFSSGEFRFGNFNYFISSFISVNSIARVINFGSAFVYSAGGITIGNTNYTISPNTATLTVYAASATISCPDGVNFNGATLRFMNSNSCSILNSCTFKNIVFAQPNTFTLTITSGKTLTITDNFYCYPKGGIVTFNSGTISKPSGTVSMYSVMVNSTIFTGGATWNAYYNSAVFTTGLGVNVFGGTFFIDSSIGDDTIYGGYGWWKVNYTGAVGAIPSQDEVGTGAISGAICKIIGMIDSYDWGNGTGTLFFYGKVGTFQAETINFTNGGSILISGDLQNSAYKSFPVIAKYGALDSFKFAKSPDPTNTGQNAQWTSPTWQGGGIPPYITPTSSTNTTPIIITKAAHGYVTGNILHLWGHAVNTNANGVWFITWLSANTFSLDNSVGNGVGGATGSMANITTKSVVIDTAVTDEICNCDVSWTPGVNVSSANLYQSYFRFSNGSINIVTGASCGANQIIAKFGLSASLNLSTKQQISFWFRSAALIVAGELLIKLYSDTACTIEVEALPIPVYPYSSMWIPITIDKGSNLSSTVQGVALYATLAQPSKTFYIDNIIACKSSSSPDSITLQSLISKNIANQFADDVFIGIQGIKGKILILDNTQVELAYQGRGYFGVTEKVSLYKRESTKINSIQNPFISIPKGGTIALPLSVVGGYDKITNNKNGLTILDNFTPGGYTTAMNITGVVLLDNFQFTRWYTPLNQVGDGSVIQNIIVTNCTNAQQFGTAYNILNIKAINNSAGIVYSSGYFLKYPSQNIISISNMAIGINFGAIAGTISTALAYNNATGIYFNAGAAGGTLIKASYNGVGVQMGATSATGYGGNCVVDEVTECNYNSTQGVYFSQPFNTIKKILHLNGNSVGVLFSYVNSMIREITECNLNTSMIVNFSSQMCKILKITSADQNQAFVTFANGVYNNFVYNANLTNTKTDAPSLVINGGQNYLVNCTGVTSNYASINIGTKQNSKLFIHNHNATQGHRIYCEGATIFSDTATRHSLTGISWKFSVLAADRSLVNPVDLSIAKVLCTAGVQKTIAIWCNKSHATDIGCRLVIQGNKFEGVGSTASDVFVEAVNVTGWQQISMTFTPVKTEVIEVEFWAYWLANLADEFVWVDDISIV